MYAPPKFLKPEFFELWVHWALRNESGKYVVVYGKDAVPPSVAGGMGVYQIYGPCGPNPFYYFNIYKLTNQGNEEVEIKDHQEKYRGAYCSVNASDWEIIKANYPGRHLPVVWSKKKDFRGQGIIFDVEKLTEEERHELEQKFDECSNRDQEVVKMRQELRNDKKKALEEAEKTDEAVQAVNDKFFRLEARLKELEKTTMSSMKWEPKFREDRY